MGLLRSIARFFVVPCDERPEADKEYLPARYSDFSSVAKHWSHRQLKPISRKIKSQLTDEIIMYELESGHTIVAKDAMDRHSDVINQLAKDLGKI